MIKQAAKISRTKRYDIQANPDRGVADALLPSSATPLFVPPGTFGYRDSPEAWLPVFLG
jgi:hypothetical protein